MEMNQSQSSNCKPQFVYLNSGSQTTKNFDIPEFGTIGNSASAQIQIEDPLVSERHSRIEKRKDVFILRDLQSSQGTFLNNTRIIEAQINDGDVLRIGSTELQFQLNIPRNSKTPSFVASKNETFQSELNILENAAKTSFPVLLLGESGTGKDVIAQQIHTISERFGPFVSVNCSALAENLIESELFGHVRGSFTGAISDRKGAFEAARGGTLFLDEIGDLPFALQAKLLRALENNEIRPVGSDKTIKTDVRIIAATHQSLQQQIVDNKFRKDLYFRLNVISATLPSLTNRPEDFESLLYTFAKAYRVRFSFSAIQQLKQHSWPGNIRELKNLVTRASALYPNRQIETNHIDRLVDLKLIQCQSNEFMGNDAGQVYYQNRGGSVIKEIEKQMIIKRLEANKGNQRRTASELGLPKSTLHDRLRAYDIDPKMFKPGRMGKDKPKFNYPNPILPSKMEYASEQISSSKNQLPDESKFNVNPIILPFQSTHF